MSHVILTTPTWGIVSITRLILNEAKWYAKFEVSVAEKLHGVQNSKTGHLTLTTPFQGRFFIGRVGLAMVSQCTKFEVSRFTRCEATNGDAKYRKLGGFGWLGGT